MRITILTGALLSVPPAPCGAVERIWHDLAKVFAARGHEVTLMVRDHPELGEPPAGIVYRRLPEFEGTSSFLLNLGKDAAYAALALARLPHSDITVSNSVVFPLLAPLRRRTVGRVHAHIARMPKGQGRWYARAGVPRLAAVSTAVADAIRNQSPEVASRVRVFGNPIDTRHFRPGGHSRDASHRTIVYAGRIHPEKGLALLLRAYRRSLRRPGMEGTRLVLLGPHEVERGGGGEGYLGKLRALAEGLPVDFRPAVYDRAALARVYQQADVFVYPSLAEKGESFGVAPLEAMATGLVPVVSDLAVFRDFIVPGETGIVFDHRGRRAAGNLAKALHRVLSLNLAERERLREAAMAIAARFSLERIADAYLADFEELAGNN